MTNTLDKLKQEYCKRCIITKYKMDCCKEQARDEGGGNCQAYNEAIEGVRKVIGEVMLEDEPCYASELERILTGTNTKNDTNQTGKGERMTIIDEIMKAVEPLGLTMWSIVAYPEKVNDGKKNFEITKFRIELNGHIDIYKKWLKEENELYKLVKSVGVGSKWVGI